MHEVEEERMKSITGVCVCVCVCVCIGHISSVAAGQSVSPRWKVGRVGNGIIYFSI